MNVSKLTLYLGIPLLYGSFLCSFSLAAPAESNEYLSMDISQLLNVTITSVSKKPQTVSAAAAAVFVITEDDIRRSGVTSIAEALAMAPGLHVAQISASKWSVSSRGFSGYTSNKLLVLIDGRSVYAPAFSGTFWDMQNTLLEDIDRIEVIRGPGGTLWGANAVNGVINIITKNAHETQDNLIRIGVGNQEKVQGGVRIGAALSETLSGRISLSYNNRAENELLSSGGGDDAWQHVQGSFRLDGKTSHGDDWTVQGDIYKNDEDQIVSPFWQPFPPFLDELQGDLTVQGNNLLSRYSHQFNPDTSLTLQTYYDYYDREEGYFQQKYSAIDVDLQLQTRAGDIHSITMGMEYRHTEVDFMQSFQVSLQDQTDNLFSAFMQDEITLMPEHLWLTLGTKWEKRDHIDAEWQPSARILWKPQARHSLWASIARAVRTPSIVETNGRVTVAVFPTAAGLATASLVGNASFESENLIAYEAGYRWQPIDKLSIDLAFFYNDYDNLFDVQPDSTGASFDLSFSNSVSGKGTGGELAVEWKPLRELAVMLSYSYLNLEISQDDPNSPITTFADQIENSSPRHQVSLRSTYTPSETWQFNIWLRYIDDIAARNTSSLFDNVEIPIEDYVLLSTNIIWKPTESIEVMLAGQNVLEKSQLQYISEFTTPPTEIERSIYGKITWRW